MDANVSYQALFTAYLVLLVVFGFIAFCCLVVLALTIPTLLHPYFYGDGAVLLATGIVQITFGILLLAIDRNKCCCGKEIIANNLKSVLFPVSLALFAALWITLLAMPHNNVLQLKEGLEEEVRQNSSNGIMQLAHSAFNCCGIDSVIMGCQENYLPVYSNNGSTLIEHQCPIGSDLCQRGCLLAVWQYMILPYRPIEMALGLFGLLLLAVCPLTYAISRCRLYWCPPVERQESPVEPMPFLADMDEMPLYPRPAQFNPVLSSLLPMNVQPDENSPGLQS